MKAADAILDAADSHRLIERLTDGDPSLDEAPTRSRGTCTRDGVSAASGQGRLGPGRHGWAFTNSCSNLKPLRYLVEEKTADPHLGATRSLLPADVSEAVTQSSNASTLNGLTASQIVSQAVTQSSGQIAGGILAFLNSAYTVTNAGTVFSGFCAFTATFCNGGDFLP